MSLSSLLVQRGIATTRTVEEAISNQVLRGGDLATNLLEIGAVPEDALTRAAADAAGLMAVAPGPLPNGGAQVTGAIAGDFAAKYKIFPLEVSDQKWVVAAVERPSSTLALPPGVELEIRVALAVRIEEAIAKTYGFPLSARTRAILSKAGTSERASGRPQARPVFAGARRRKGPFGLPQAQMALSEAQSAEAILSVVFDFALQFFGYSVLFVIHGELAEGREAFGCGPPSDQVRQVGIPLDLPGVIRDARQGRSAVSVQLVDHGIDQDLSAQLARPESLGKVALLPIVVRGRAIAVIWGDDGPEDVDLRGLAPVMTLLSEATVALERSILSRKRHGEVHEEVSPTSVSPPPAAVSHPTLEGLDESWADISGAIAENADAEPRSSVIPEPVVMLGPRYEEFVQKLLTGADVDGAFGRLAQGGEEAASAVLDAFPGPVPAIKGRAMESLPTASQCGILLELVVGMKRACLRGVIDRTSAADAVMRFWATHTLGELGYIESAVAVVPRLFDVDPVVRSAARRSAHALLSLPPAAAHIADELERTLREREVPAERRLLAASCVEALRLALGVPALIQALDDPDPELVDVATQALITITRKEFGRDASRYHDWWLENAKRHRIEWLIDALTDESPSMRKDAGEELKALTKEYFGYYADLPRKERERAQERYRQWWTTEGRSKYGSAPRSFDRGA